jgi:hypothetical protein
MAASGGDPHLVPPIFDHLAQARLGLTVGVNPRGVVVTDAPVDGGVDDLDRLLFGAVMFIHDPLPTEAQDRE